MMIAAREPFGKPSFCRARASGSAASLNWRYVSLAFSRLRSASIRQTSSGQRSSAARKAAPRESNCRRSSIRNSNCPKCARLSFCNSQPGLDALGECAEVADALKFVVGQLDMKMLFETGEQIERLQTVDPERFEEIVIRGQLLARDTEVRGGELQHFAERVVRGHHFTFLGRFLLSLTVNRAERPCYRRTSEGQLRQRAA